MRNDEDIQDAMCQYGDAVLRSCLSTLANRHDAEDAFQETFLRYSLHDADFANENHRKAWLVRVAVNISRDRLRKASMRDIPLESTAESQTPQTEDNTDQRMQIRQALGQLSPDQRTAILLSVVEGFPAREIAEMMNMPENTVYSLIARGKKKLREVLAQ